MILDTSAVLAIVLGEDDAEDMLALMSQADQLGIGAATLLEALIVAEARQGPEAALDVHALLADLEVDVVPTDEEAVLLAHEGWQRFGKGRHPAGLNLGDCYSYGTAKALRRALLYKGDDFGQTDVEAARPRTGRR